MSEIEKLNMIAEWQEQHKQLIEDLDNSKKRIEELEEKISVLLSCKNCPENKGGLICAKEYENKCLAQKIEFIKELQEENKELTLKISKLESDCDAYNYSQRTYQDEIKELKAQIEKMNKRKVFLLQKVDSDDYSIDKQFYTTDEDIAKEWDRYYKPNCCYGEAIELEEFSDKERIREKLES